MEEKKEQNCTICGVEVQGQIKCYECTIMFWDSFGDENEANKRTDDYKYF